MVQAGGRVPDQGRAAQAEGGYWSEGGGPVVLYDFVYVDALGTVLRHVGRSPRAAGPGESGPLPRRFTYPDGRCRGNHQPAQSLPSVGGVGQRGLHRFRRSAGPTWRGNGRIAPALDADLMASLPGRRRRGRRPTFPRAATHPSPHPQGPRRRAGGRGPQRPLVLLRLGLHHAGHRLRSAPGPPEPGEHLSRQPGLILGGGNTKLQPAWSTFTVGDVSLWSTRQATPIPISCRRREDSSACLGLHFDPRAGARPRP